MVWVVVSVRLLRVTVRFANVRDGSFRGVAYVCSAFSVVKLISSSVGAEKHITNRIDRVTFISLHVVVTLWSSRYFRFRRQNVILIQPLGCFFSRRTWVTSLQINKVPSACIPHTCAFKRSLEYIGWQWCNFFPLYARWFCRHLAGKTLRNVWHCDSA